MGRTSLIFVHELTGTIRRGGFIVMTLIVPILALLAIGIGRIVSASFVPHAAETSRIGYVDATSRFGQFREQGTISLVPFATAADATRELTGGGIREYFVISSDFTATLTLSRFTMEKEFVPPAAASAAIKSFLTSNLLAGSVPDADVRIVEAPLSIATTRLGADGAIATDQGGVGNALIPLAFCLLLALSLIFSSSYLLQGLVEEKENRLMEVLVSRVTPSELLVGKVLGLGAAGLVQVLVWLASLPLLLGLASATIGGFATLLRVPVLFYALAVPYFLLGYLLIATLCAAVGAISSNAREGGPLSALFTLFPVVPLWFMSLYLNFPTNPIWVVLSIFPLTAPVMVIERIAIADIPAWQIAASLGVLAVCVAAALFISARVFRTWLLMYGKRPRLGEVMKSIWSV